MRDTPDYSEYAQAEKPADVRRARRRLWAAWSEFNDALFEASPTVLREVAQHIGEKHMRHLIDALEAFRAEGRVRRGPRNLDQVLYRLVQEELAHWPGKEKWSFRGGRAKSETTGRRKGKTQTVPNKLTGWLYPRVKRRADALGVRFSESRLRTILRKRRVQQIGTK